ncbi:Cystathionine beta-lyase PatB [bioreactor metagenome]|uniref:cysteine-S-conjugate beta-lyase n=1 Tax=bioreactor metagenome TaxID=1076179 RepID=A0A644ZI65_9ZZZZ
MVHVAPVSIFAAAIVGKICVVHIHLTRIGVEHHPLLVVAPEYRDRIMICTAPTKTFNIAGLGISNIVIPNPEYRKKYQFFMGKRLGVEVNPLSMVATVAAYNECQDWLEQLRVYLDDNIAYVRNFIAENFPKAHVVDTQGTYLVWINFGAYTKDANALERWTRYRAGVILDEGYVFGEEGVGFERINVATPRSVLRDCMERMRRTFPF